MIDKSIVRRILPLNLSNMGYKSISIFSFISESNHFLQSDLSWPWCKAHRLSYDFHMIQYNLKNRFQGPVAKLIYFKSCTVLYAWTYRHTLTDICQSKFAVLFPQFYLVEVKLQRALHHRMFYSILKKHGSETAAMFPTKNQPAAYFCNTKN